ncbi:MAG: hypothetical protein M5U08_06610 [Burkholderiales bacterium]|nr:hypothetical protein [Burkholderiales bacterium]
MLAAVGWLTAPSAHAEARASAPRLPAEAARAFPDLAPLGSGTMRWFGFHVYDARLWATGLAPRDDTPYVLALRYARDFEGARIAQTSIVEIERLGLGTPVQRAHWLAEMRRVFPDVQAGAEIAGLHVPGRGALLPRRPAGRHDRRCGVRARVLRHLARSAHPRARAARGAGRRGRPVTR